MSMNHLQITIYRHLLHALFPEWFDLKALYKKGPEYNIVYTHDVLSTTATLFCTISEVDLYPNNHCKESHSSQIYFKAVFEREIIK